MWKRIVNPPKGEDGQELRVFVKDVSCKGRAKYIAQLTWPNVVDGQVRHEAVSDSGFLVQL